MPVGRLLLPPARMDLMADMRRGSPEPPPGAPHIQYKPGVADEMLHELAPLLAEEGIDVDNIDVPDLQTLQAAMNRAVERRNMELFTPVGPARDIAVTTLRLIVEAILDGNTTMAGELLDQVQPESADNTTATVASCIGIALGLLDQWLSGHGPDTPADLSRHTLLPAGHWTGKRAASDILTLASKNRAFQSLDKLITQQGSPQVLAGSVLTLAAVAETWAQRSDTSRTELIETAIR